MLSIKNGARFLSVRIDGSILTLVLIGAITAVVATIMFNKQADEERRASAYIGSQATEYCKSKRERFLYFNNLSYGALGARGVPTIIKAACQAPSSSVASIGEIHEYRLTVNMH